MYRHWEQIIQPLLERLEPDVIVEVGSDQGYNTRNLLAYCQRTGATFHAVDPLPKFDVEEWNREYTDTLTFHRKTSLEALSSIGRADVVLIDGDHNWHTVFHELKALEEIAEANFGQYPVVLLHDVGWPYGRRDLYYEPDRIPEPHRQVYGKGGLRPGRTDLDPGGGLNSHLLNAVREGGERNGVLTAAEDFVDQTRLHLELLSVPGINGLGILLPAELRSQKAAVSEFLDQLTGSPVLFHILERVEALRIDSLIEALDRKRELEEAGSRLTQRKAQLESLKQERDRQIAELNIRLKSVKQERDRQIAELNIRLKSVKQEQDKQIAELNIRLESVKQERDQIAAQSKRLRGDVASNERAALSRKERIATLTGEIASLKENRDRTARQLSRLRGRRSVRVALWLASITKPVIRAWRRARVVGRRASPKPHPQAPTEQQVAATEQHGVPDRAPDRDSDVGSADIVVCIHNAMEDVRACLGSIVNTTNLVNHGLILVDDGSNEAVQRMVEEFASQYPVRLIRNDEAKGYSVAANQGIAASERPNVVLLNSDTIVGPGWLEKLIRCAEIMPEAAVVGPYSNAASWQSVPRLTSLDGTWHLNPLPDGITPADRAAEVERWSPRLYPEVPLINGFCYLITRRALNRVGSLDDQSFPRGYGEEDDFSIRCAEAGLKLYVADDSYVYHAKSRSHTPEGRRSIVAENKEILDSKHGAETIRALVDGIRSNEDLIRSRTFVAAAIERGMKDLPTPDFRDRRPLVGWLQPHLEKAGGIRRAIEMTNRLSRWGCRTALVVPDGWRTDWLPILSEVVSIDEARSMAFDLLIGSDPDMVWPFLELNAVRKVNYHLAPYMLYRNDDESLRAYYDPSHEGVVHIANSKWTAEQVRAYSGIGVEALFPGGVDKRLFHPVGIERSYEVVCHGSKRPHKGTEAIEQACSDLSLLKIEEHGSSQHHLARLINSGHVYVSAAWHEGFNMAALEAMASGVPVVMTDDGGSRDYAVDGENALVVEPKDPSALREQILRVRDDSGLRAHLIENGLETAWAYDWDTVTLDLADFLIANA